MGGWGPRRDGIEQAPWDGLLAAAPVISFLARLAASRPSDAVTRRAVETVADLVYAPIDRHDATGAELDEQIDAVRVALLGHRDALEEAARLVPAAGPFAARLLAEAGAGAHEPRWRGIAWPFVRARASEIGVLAGPDGPVVALAGDCALRFHQPDNGRLLAVFSRRQRADHALREQRHDMMLPFCDAFGLGVVTGRKRLLGPEPRRSTATAVLSSPSPPP
ncbi:hypothetical protein FHR83_009164 [Actinoplanes campanulatus]|uniref:Uncharacterized protein n=1 Tax=Actinoplanes campanulatus TaxID=113559 RepID=A0A7W5ASD4_9ACTN|nr:hypothetical protein [Actinoplanes campanulatus]MBB3101435.1 hypothetical protein [Actinoplanes campanulatus]GGN50383.1 hypothetical protein GCM10010109_89530 [Actinoplanes campanulatus]GID42503.1 hypothetical protein Aca09nite_90090 [Actinoplanes campanulatus]